jgi:hypothetical protein
VRTSTIQTGASDDQRSLSAVPSARPDFAEPDRPLSHDPLQGRGGSAAKPPDGRILFPAQLGGPAVDRFGLAYLHIVDGLAFGFHNLGEPMTLMEFRKVFHGPLIGNCGYTKETPENAIAAGHADLISFGRPFISNPDLVERFRNDWPLAELAPMSDWYSPAGAKGYTDFPRASPRNN